MRRRGLALVALLLVAAGKPPEAMVEVGEPVSCLQASRIRSTTVVDDRSIDFRMLDGTIYRNRLPYQCPGLGAERIFSYRLWSPQLCKVDTITVLYSAAGWLRPGALCGLGPFVPVRPAG